MNSSTCTARGRQIATFRILELAFAIVPLWLLLIEADIPAYAQTSDAAAVSSASTPATSFPGDWTEFHRDNMQRWNPYETVVGVNNVGKFGLKWRSPFVPYPTSSPAVAKGVVYINASGNVYALDANTGAKLWSYAISSVFGYSSPAVANGVVYIGAEYPDGNVYALNAATGALIWKYATGGYVYSSPTVADGVVYVDAFETSFPFGSVYALNANTGEKLWSYTNGAAYSSPAIANGVVYVGSLDGNVYALNASTGDKLWSHIVGYGLDSSPAIANGIVYIGEYDGSYASGGVYALNASTGDKLWSFTTGGPVYTSPAVANGVVYIGSDDWNVYALNANTGAKLWSFKAAYSIDSSPAVANGVVYIEDYFFNVYALDSRTGALLWSYPTGGEVLYSSSALANGTLYLNGGSYLYAFSVGADLNLRIKPSSTPVAQGDLLTYAFSVWNLGPDKADHEVLKTEVPDGTTFDYIRISGTKRLGTCTTPRYGGTGEIVCHENSAMAPNTTWSVRLTVKVTAPSGTVITERGTVTEETTDPNLANTTATVSVTVE